MYLRFSAIILTLTRFERYQMDHPAALHRLKVGVPATIEHSSEAGPETGKWVAETTQARLVLNILRRRGLIVP